MEAPFALAQSLQILLRMICNVNDCERSIDGVAFLTSRTLVELVCRHCICQSLYQRCEDSLDVS